MLPQIDRSEEVAGSHVRMWATLLCTNLCSYIERLSSHKRASVPKSVAMQGDCRKPASFLLQDELGCCERCQSNSYLHPRMLCACCAFTISSQPSCTIQVHQVSLLTTLCPIRTNFTYMICILIVTPMKDTEVHFYCL